MVTADEIVSGMPRWCWAKCCRCSAVIGKIRAGDTRDSELKIRWTIGSQAAFVPFGGTPNQLNQDVVTDVRLDV